MKLELYNFESCMVSNCITRFGCSSNFKLQEFSNIPLIISYKYFTREQNHEHQARSTHHHQQLNQHQSRFKNPIPRESNKVIAAVSSQRGKLLLKWVIRSLHLLNTIKAKAYQKEFKGINAS